MTESPSPVGSSVKLSDLEPILWRLHPIGANSMITLRQYTNGYVIAFGNNFLDDQGKWKHHTDGINAPMFKTSEEALAVWNSLSAAMKDNPRGA